MANIDISVTNRVKATVTFGDETYTIRPMKAYRAELLQRRYRDKVRELFPDGKNELTTDELEARINGIEELSHYIVSTLFEASDAERIETRLSDDYDGLEPMTIIANFHPMIEAMFADPTTSSSASSVGEEPTGSDSTGKPSNEESSFLISE